MRDDTVSLVYSVWVLFCTAAPVDYDRLNQVNQIWWSDGFVGSAVTTGCKRTCPGEPSHLWMNSTQHSCLAISALRNAKCHFQLDLVLFPKWAMHQTSNQELIKHIFHFSKSPQFTFAGSVSHSAPTNITHRTNVGLLMRHKATWLWRRILYE